MEKINYLLARLLFPLLIPEGRVFAYVGGAGYVRVGEVTGQTIPARDATVEFEGERRSLVDIPELPETFRERARSEDPERTEMVVPVSWIETRPLDQAV